MASSTSAGDTAASETSPLLQSNIASRSTSATKAQRNVTFNPQISASSPPKRRPGFPAASVQSQSAESISAATLSSSARDGNHSTLSALNNKLRRRNSSGAALQLPTLHPGPKIGPQRTTRTAQKLKLLPDPEHGEEGPDEESGREVYSQFTRIKDPTARRDAARLGKDDRVKLPRVTAYCTASSYGLDDLSRFLKGRMKTKGTNPKLFDECLYSPYSYRKDSPASEGRSTENQQEQSGAVAVRSQPQRRFSDSAIEVEENSAQRREDLIDLNTEAGDTTLETGEASQPINLRVEEGLLPTTSMDRIATPDLDTTVHVPEVFLFEYGVVVIWGMTLKEEQRFLKEIAKFEQEKLGKDDVQTEEFNFYYTREYQARIYNDFISLREKRNYMTKLAISHALAQSVKV